jgi:hypothetical protein
MPIVASLLAVTFGTSSIAAPQDQTPKTNIEQQLAAQYRPTTMSRSGEMVTAGSVLVLQKQGLLMYTVANPMPPQSTYKNGKISRNPLGRGFGGDLINALNKPGPSASIEQRTLAAGELLWVTKVDIHKDGVVFRLYSNPYGYFGELKFPFAKNAVPPADQLLSTIAEVFAVQPDGASPAPATPPETPVTAPIAPPATPADQAPTQPPTISLGLTIDQVVAIMGQPERVADLGSKKIYSYKDMKITFLDGKVSDIQ